MAARTEAAPMLSAQDLLAGSGVVHTIHVPQAVLTPGVGSQGDAPSGQVRMRPLSVATITLISRAARDDVSLVPLLMIKESLVEPALTLDQIRSMHVGLVHFLVGQVNQISGLSADGEALDDAAGSPIGRTHLLLAKHFGWTPDQVGQLTPGQVAVYLAGIEQLLRLEEAKAHDR
jgi:hypothetical protein